MEQREAFLEENDDTFVGMSHSRAYISHCGGFKGNVMVVSLFGWIMVYSSYVGGDSPPRVWRENHIYRPLTLILNIISSWLQSNKEVFSSLIIFTTSYLSRVYYVRKNNTSLFLYRYMVYYGSGRGVLWFAGTLEKVGFTCCNSFRGWPLVML